MGDYSILASIWGFRLFWETTLSQGMFRLDVGKLQMVQVSACVRARWFNYNSPTLSEAWWLPLNYTTAVRRNRWAKKRFGQVIKVFLMGVLIWRE